MTMIRYQKLGYVGINVTDVERSRRFYQDVLGLQFVEIGPDGGVRYRCSDDRYSVVLHQNDTPGLRFTGFMLEDDAQYAAVRARMEERGVACEAIGPQECADRDLASGLRIAEPNLNGAFEFYRPRPQDADASFVPTVAKIQRIGHVVVGTPRYRETIDFFNDVLNFAPSDEIDGIIRFFRLFPNPYHHGMGVCVSPNNCLHHVNFMVSEIDDIGAALNRFKRHDVPVVFGPGRHIASNSVFLYFLDPDGLTLEYSFGMEEFPERDARDARVLPPRPESLDSWGGVRDARMAAVGLVQPFETGRGWLPVTGSAGV
jgi:2,3-dihydroxy-p-cumate/2,3-dihydroxybenzoate 3,4-dioxygenase